MVGVVDFEARLAALVMIENDKVALVQDLIERVKCLENGISDAERNLERERLVSDMYQRRDQEKDVELRTIKQSLALMNYVLVLVDGDCMPFIDELLKGGESGGCQASRMLKTTVSEHIRNQHADLPPNMRVVIRVYANLKGVAKAYCDAQVLERQSDLGPFINGFNKEDSLCDFVNAGDGKECADEKMKATFQLGIENVQCRHIIFGGSADNGYARLLGPHVESTQVTLLKGPPFARELAELAMKYPTLDCPTVFRQTKLLGRSNLLDLTPPRSPAQGNAIVSNYATVATAPQRSTNVATNGVVTAGSTNNGRVARNAAGLRVDIPVQFSRAEVKLLKSRKLCNEHHILGNCRYRGCLFKHGTRISGGSLQALRHVARLSSCPQGLLCSEPNCILGHRCTRDGCKNSNGCFFPAEMHGVDARIVSIEG